MKAIKDNFESHREEVVRQILAGKTFIYPTDTIYGLGCGATNEKAVRRLREIKLRETKPFSVIAPSFEWIREVCEVGDGKELGLLPGPYTLIYRIKKENIVAPSVNPDGKTLGVRIPDHWFSKWIGLAGVPFVTTSVNLSGERHMET